MNTLDIPFPDSEYQGLIKLKGFNLIYPSDHPFALKLTINMMIRAVSFEDEDYLSLLNKDINPMELSPVGAKLFDIDYIRECALVNIAPFEWRKNYGPDNLNRYLQATKTPSGDCYGKIISLKFPDYSLDILNKRYGENQKSR